MLRNRGIGRYYFYSILFHGVLVGLVIYLGIKYKPEIRSIGSKVVVTVVSRVPGQLFHEHRYRPAHALRHVAEKKARKRIIKEKPVSHLLITKKPASLVYPEKTKKKKEKEFSVKKRNKPAKLIQQVNKGVYSRLGNSISLNSAYGKLKESLVRGNVHRFESYAGKIHSIIMSNFNININKYLNYKSTVAFQISSTGVVFDVRLVKSSGSGYFDSQSEEAVISSSPLPPPPKGFMGFINSNNAGEGVLVNFNPKSLSKG